MSSSNPRWAYPTWIQGAEVTAFWRTIAADPTSSVLYISGLGFDPRMLLGMRAVLEAFPPERRHCVMMIAEIAEVAADDTLSDLTAANLTEAQTIIGSAVSPAVFPMFSGTESIVGPRLVNDHVSKVIQVQSANHWVVDVSSLPRIIFIPLISMLIAHADRLRSQGKKQNFHVIVGDNSEIDRAIAGTGIDLSATPSLGFSASVESDSKRHIPRVWIPLLGDNQEGNLRNVRNYADPDNNAVILPMIPFPALDPRRPDAVLTSHRILFEEFGVEVGNILYAGESNPFDVYQQVLSISHSYNENMKDLGGANIILSPLSSKVQSIGVCLAAHELKARGVLVAIVQTMPTSYQFTNTDYGETRLQSLWLSGDGV